MVLFLCGDKMAAKKTRGSFSYPPLAGRWLAIAPLVRHPPALEEDSQPLVDFIDEVDAIGMTGFEPATSCSQSRRATKLRYIPDSFFYYSIILRGKVKTFFGKGEGCRGETSDGDPSCSSLPLPEEEANNPNIQTALGEVKPLR